MPMEYLHPYRMGYRPVLFDEAKKFEDWTGLMVEFDPFTQKRLVKSFHQFFTDKRINTAHSIRLASDLLPILISNKGKVPQLDAVFLENNSNKNEEGENTDPADLLNAFPALRKCYIKSGMEHPQEPLRHICLEYLGLPINSIAQKNLHDLVLPELQILSLNFHGVGFDDPDEETEPLIDSLVQDLVSVMKGDIFPRIERLHLKYCSFLNQLLTAAFVENTSPLKINRLDLMDSYQGNTLWGLSSSELEILATSPLAKSIQFTIDGTHQDKFVDLLGYRLRQGIDVLPY